MCNDFRTNAHNVLLADALFADFLANGCRDELADRGFLVYGVCSAAYFRRVVNTLGWSRRCATYFLTNGGKLALPHLMCASQFSEAMNPSKWRLLRCVSVRDVFGGTCDIFLAAAGMVVQFRACP